MRIAESRTVWTSRLLLALAAGVTLAMPAEALVDYQFSALWRSDAPQSTLLMEDSLGDFEDAIDAQYLLGKKLVAFESWGSGTRHYAGLFRSIAADTFFFVGYNTGDFENLRVAEAGADHQLIDVEVRLVGTARVYSGLFMESNTEVDEFALDNLNATNFEWWWDWVKDTYHLVAFDTWFDGTEARYYSVYRLGAEPAGAELTVAAYYSTFATELAARNSGGSHDVVANFEVTPVGRAAQITAKWVPLWRRAWLGVSYEEDWLTDAAGYFVAGQPTAVFDVQPGQLLDPATEDPMYIYDLEITDLYYTLPSGGLSPTLVKPLINSGTPGPPK